MNRSESIDRSRASLTPCLAVLGGLLALALGAPLLANDKPLFLKTGGGISFPAAADLPWVGRLFATDGMSSTASPEEQPQEERALWPPVRYSYRGVRLEEALSPPSRAHLMGTDSLGRDILARVIHGARVSILVGLGATLVSLLLGALLGGTAGLRGGFTDLSLTRVVEILGCFPSFLLAMVLVAVFPSDGLWPIILAIGLGRTAAAARLVRGEVLRYKGGAVWIAARSAGASLPGIAMRHILPLAVVPLVVQAAFGVVYAIVLESGLSFLGVGVQPPTPSWGLVLADGRSSLDVAWWPILFPSAAIALTLGLLLWAGERTAGERAP